VSVGPDLHEDTACGKKEAERQWNPGAKTTDQAPGERRVDRQDQRQRQESQTSQQRGIATHLLANLVIAPNDRTKRPGS